MIIKIVNILIYLYLFQINLLIYQQRKDEEEVQEIHQKLKAV